MKAPLLTGGAPKEVLLAKLPKIKRSMVEQAEVLAVEMERGIKEAFSIAITGLFGVGLWIIVVAFVITWFIPALPFGEARPVEGKSLKKQAAGEQAGDTAHHSFQVSGRKQMS